MNWNGLVASLAPEMLNLEEDALREIEICACGLIFPVSLVGQRGTLRG
jgi:hypothetical protein